MSEQQVLPELDTFHYLKADEDLWQMYERHLRCRERQLSTALASLAQSEAERERLQGELAGVRDTANFWLDAHARERERNQELRHLVNTAPLRVCDRLEGWTKHRNRLLEDKSKPVATGEK